MTTGQTPGVSRIQDTFAGLRRAGNRAFIPFLTAGDPDLDFTAQAIERLVAAGSSLIEIGFPYSDPIADGPVIQASYARAIDRGLKVAEILAMLRRVSGKVAVPLVAMVSMAIVRRRGVHEFIRAAAEAGLTGLIVPDLPLEEAIDFSKACRIGGLDLIPLITPTTTPARALRITQAASGFLYYVAVTGITGERAVLSDQLAPRVSWLRGQTSLPICIGFGVSRPEQARELGAIADGVIVGSALVRRVNDAATPAEGLDAIEGLARQMVAACHHQT